MSLIQFLRIMWAHRMLTFASVVVGLVAAIATITLVTPRYEAQSRVMLDVIKPDPVTGEVIASAYLKVYTRNQIESVKGEGVAQMVVDELKLANDPVMQQAYRARSKDLDLSFRSWAAKEIIKDTRADILLGSNIMEITYSSSSPARAKQVADALLKAYRDTALQSRQESARRNAEWYEAQAEKARTILVAAESSKTTYERQNNIMLQATGVDIDSARLAALAAQGGSPVIAAPSAGNSASSAQLAALDLEIAEQTRTLGPNHPLLQQLKSRRTALAAQVQQERAAMNSASATAVSAASVSSGLLEAQKAKVMGQREKVEQLRLMQDAIDLRRDQYNKAVARAAQLRQEAEIADPGVTPVAAATTPQAPVFPNRPLILGASIPVSLGIGLLLGLALEFIGRRIRSAEDLGAATTAPVLAVIRKSAGAKRAKGGWLGLRLPRSGRRRMASA